MGVEVRAGVVEGVAEPGGARHADDDRDQRAEADRRERGAGSCPVPGQIPQREPHRDRAPPSGGGDHRQAGRGEQDDGDGERDEADGEFQRPVVLASAAASRGPGRAEQEERADQEAETDRDGQVPGLLRRGRPAGQRGHDRDSRDRLRRPGGGEVGRDDRQGHGDADDRPRQLEHAHDVVRAVFRLRAVGKPGEEAEHQLPRRRPRCRWRRRWPARPGGCAAASPPGRRACRSPCSLRCARTVKPPTPTSAISSMPRTAAAIEIVSGLTSLVLATVCAVVTFMLLVRQARRAYPGRVEQHRYVVRVRDLAGDDQGELVEQAFRVLDDARYFPGRRRLRSSCCRFSGGSRSRPRWSRRPGSPWRGTGR